MKSAFTAEIEVPGTYVAKFPFTVTQSAIVAVGQPVAVTSCAIVPPP